MQRSTLAFRFAKLYPGAGDPLERGIAIVEGDRITKIGGPHTPIPDDARTFEAECIIPGLINAHVHLEMSGEPRTMDVFVLTTPTQRALACAQNARDALRSGVTTVRDLGSTEGLAADVRDAVAAGKLDGPTVLSAGRAICMTGGHGWFVGREADGEWDVRKAVREQLRSGADCIKFIATGGVLTKGAVPGIEQLSESELRAGIDEAHRAGLRCAAHAIGTAGIKNALRAGIDSIEHGHLLDDEAIALFVEHRAHLVPTLAAIVCILEGAAGDMPEFVMRKAREIAEHATGNLRKARTAGVRFAGGADSGTPFNPHGGYAFEVELMQSMLEMSPHEALETATVHAADLLGVARGRLEEGAVADLVVLRTDITSDARPFRDPALVVKSGDVAYERP